MLKWTTEKPTQPGFYWYRDKTCKLIREQEPQVVHVESPEMIYMAGDDMTYCLPGHITECAVELSRVGQWAGPIAPPEG